MDAIAELVEGVNAVCGTDPSVVADCEAIEALYRQLDRLEAAVCRASACFDAGGEWQADGARERGGVDRHPSPDAVGDSPPAGAPRSGSAPAAGHRGGVVGRRRRHRPGVGNGRRPY